MLVADLEHEARGCVQRPANEAVAGEATRRGRPQERVLRLEGVSECKCIVFVSNP